MGGFVANLIFSPRSSIRDGLIIITDEKGFNEMQTRACPHCGGHFIVIPGSGKLRHFCHLCHAATCDKVQCYEHSSFEKRLDLVETGKLPLRAL